MDERLGCISSSKSFSIADSYTSFSRYPAIVAEPNRGHYWLAHSVFITANHRPFGNDGGRNRCLAWHPYVLDLLVGESSMIFLFRLFIIRPMLQIA